MTRGHVGSDDAARRPSSASRPRRLLGLVGAALAATLALSACSADAGPTVDLPAQAAETLPDDMTTAFAAAVENAMQSSKASGAIVGVWVPWSGSWVEAMGEDVETDMTFRAGDVTRAMTCDVLYGMAADGTVELDDPVSSHVPGYPNLSSITLEQLCDGTSGLAPFSSTLEQQWITNPDRRWHALELAAYGLGQSEPTGTHTAYDGSDTGYVLLGSALQRASGLSASVMFDRYVFQPLGLDRTALPGAAPSAPTVGGSTPLLGFEALPGAEGQLDCAAPTDMTSRSASFGFTDSGVVSDVTDLGRYTQYLALRAGDDEQDRWASPLPARPDAPGWFTATGGTLQAGSLVGQFGEVPGYLTAAFADRSTGLTVVAVLDNSTASADLVSALVFELAAIASKAPAAEGFEQAELGLPWTPEQFREAATAAAVCG